MLFIVTHFFKKPYARFSPLFCFVSIFSFVFVGKLLFLFWCCFVIWKRSFALSLALRRKTTNNVIDYFFFILLFLFRNCDVRHFSIIRSFFVSMAFVVLFEISSCTVEKFFVEIHFEFNWIIIYAIINHFNTFFSSLIRICFAYEREPFVLNSKIHEMDRGLLHKIGLIDIRALWILLLLFWQNKMNQNEWIKSASNLYDLNHNN